MCFHVHAGMGVGIPPSPAVASAKAGPPFSAPPQPAGSPHSHRAKFFTCNTYKSPRKCCNQKTYVPAKPFRCNIYKKQGVGEVIS